MSYMALKIDLEKAYDKLEWNFIQKTLEQIKFPPEFINWIKLCIKTVQYELSINGHISGRWLPQRGIRQGDPLSPYIFIMCINLLIRKFLEGHKLGNFDGFQINRNTPPVPILCFADDCIIFCKNNKKSHDFIKETLKNFEDEAGAQY